MEIYRNDAAKLLDFRVDIFPTLWKKVAVR